MGYIIERLNEASDLFYSIYLEVWGWVFPFDLAAGFFLSLTYAFNYLAWGFSYFNDWVMYVADRVATMLTLNTVIVALQTYLIMANNAWAWVVNAFTNVSNIVNSWWSTAQQTVMVWIEDARYWLQYQLDRLSEQVSILQAAINDLLGMLPSIDEILLWFSDWWARILAPLTGWWNERLLEVNELINDALRVWFPFYDDLVRLWGDIMEFFADPLQWMYNKMDEWFERFW